MRGQLPSTASLQCFVTAVEMENVTKAAEHLCLTQSAVSRQIKQLEDSLGQALFDRVRQRVYLTPVGQRYYQQVAAPLPPLLGPALIPMTRSPDQAVLRLPYCCGLTRSPVDFK